MLMLSLILILPLLAPERLLRTHPAESYRTQPHESPQAGYCEFSFTVGDTEARGSSAPAVTAQ